MKKVTLKDIAERAGVAQITVSYVLRNMGRVSDKTRKRVLAVADELGYRPNASARMMRSGRYSTVAFVSSASINFHPHQLLHGASRELAARDMNLTYTVMEHWENIKESAPRIFRELCVDGLLVHFALNVPQDVMELIHSSRVPILWINTRGEHDCVYPDEADGGRVAAEHLVELGHRRIAWMENTRLGAKRHYSMEDRLRCFNDVLHEVGGEAVEIDCPVSDLSNADAARRRLALARELLGREDRPTAVLTMGGELAEPILFAATELGLKVPEDLSLLTFSPEPVCQSGTPISTLIQPFEETGRVAVQKLLAKIESGKKVRSRAVPFGIVTGETCAPPR